MSGADDFERRVRGEDAKIDLAGAALALARTCYPNLDEAVYIGQLDELAAAVNFERADTDEERLAAISTALFSDFGLKGNADDYYDVRNSYINEVLDRRLGIPISISLIYLEVGWRLGLKLAPVSFPGHFLVRLDVGLDLPLMVDPFNSGSLVGPEALLTQLAAAVGSADKAVQMLPRALWPSPRREVLARMLRNLDAIHAHHKDMESALIVSDLAVRLDPMNPSAVRKRGALYAHVGYTAAAVADLERYLYIAKDASDKVHVRALLAKLKEESLPVN
ncbi:MAG: tetratricopeptide repeat protein [Chromatiales bacterium]|jgi:regulator of sirC expression with transglutaminase-like and TPR domain|nr:tetratricopeptide repeat protein [Chromatiales bacterium]